MKENDKNLKTKLWDIANILRNKMDANEYKNYILGFIFFKYLSSTIEKLWIDEYGLSEEKIQNYSDTKLENLKRASLEDIGFYLSWNNHFLNIVDTIKKGNNDKLLDVLQMAFNEIQDSTIGESSSDDFSGLFDDINLSDKRLGNDYRERNKTVSDILLKVDEIDFENDSDILGDAYEYLIGQFASSAGKKGGEFYTPSQVSQLIAKIVASNDKQIDSLYDPTCGSGSLLVKAYQEIFKKNKKDKSWFKINGQELNHTTFNLARMNMFLHNIEYDNFKILQGDTIKNDRFEDEKYDAIVANPPFGTKWDPQEKDYLNDKRFSKYGKLAPASRAEYTFVQHMLEHLSDDGIMATVLPHGVLFRGGSEEVIRRYIIEQENQLDAIIGLPANLFFGTGIPAIIAVYKKCRKDDEPILFVDASKGFEKQKNQNILREKDIDDILNVYVNKLEIDKKNEDYDLASKLVTIDEIKENDFNLNITRYVDTFEEETYRPLSEIKADILKVQKEKEELLIKIKEQEEELFRELGIKFK